jgi:hypothetical protein
MEQGDCPEWRWFKVFLKEKYPANIRIVRLKE